MPPTRPRRLLADLDPEQREAVLATSGPVAILAGAGTGKTRVISRRAAYAIATGVVPADQVLVVTFTDKAAGEMVDAAPALGLPGVTARTFHAHALSQLRHFWPLRHDGAPLPELLDSKLPILGRLARQLPGHYRFTPAKDLADEIEWAKSRRIAPAAYERRGGSDREPPIPVDLFVRMFADYERAKARAGRIDFDDLLSRRSTCSRTTRRPRRPSAPASAGSASTSTRTRTRSSSGCSSCGSASRGTCAWSATRTRRSTRSPGRRSAFLTDVRRPLARRRGSSRSTGTTARRRRCWTLANRLIAAEGRTKRLVATRGDGPTPAISKHAIGRGGADAWWPGSARGWGRGSRPRRSRCSSG